MRRGEARGARALYICNLREEIFMRFQWDSVPTNCIELEPRSYKTRTSMQFQRFECILNDLPKSTKCILNLRDIPNSLRSLQSIPNDLSEYTKSIRKIYYSIRFHGIFDSYIISFQPLAFPLPDLWHAHRPNITLPEKFTTLFPCSHLFAFLNFLTRPNIPYQRSEIHRATDGSGSEWWEPLERKSSVIFSLYIYSVSKHSTLCFWF